MERLLVVTHFNPNTMKQSEVRKFGKQIIDDVFSGLVKSKNKEDWIKAFSFLVKKLAELERKAGLPSAIDHDIRELWGWSSARKQLSKIYGRKFIIPNLKNNDAN